jgi:phosphatidylserine/phosphatidylglycerophosphate/cardiolipin synthase-like enzyme
MAAYGFTDKAACDALIRARARGVDVALLMDATEASGRSQKPLVGLMRDAEIVIAIGKSPKRHQLLHAKFVVVDDLYVEDGSWNYSGQSACNQFNELNFCKSANRAKQFTSAWETMFQSIQEKHANE